MSERTENPFKHRWRLDDPEWVRQRKDQWKYVKENLKAAEVVSTQDLKYLRDYFVSGIEPPKYIGNTTTRVRFSPQHRIAFTPSATEAEVIELFESRPPYEYEYMLSFAWSGGGGALNSPISYAVGQEELISHALLPGKYEEKAIEYNGKSYLKYVPAERFIPQFERGMYNYLTFAYRNEYYSGQYNADYYLACVRHLEQQAKAFSHHVLLPNFMSCVFNFVDPRASLGEQSGASKFVEYFRTRLLQDDVPRTIKKVIDKLGPNRVFEFSRANLPKEEILCCSRNFVSDWRMPIPRALHNINQIEAIKVFINSARRVSLVSENFACPDGVAVDLAAALSKPFKEKLGYQDAEPLPAWRISFYYEPDVHFSNHVEAKLGVDLFLPMLKVKHGKDVSTLLYFPRASEHYRAYYVTEILELKERQLRRDVFDTCGEQLFDYSEDTDPGNEEAQLSNPHIAAGFEIVKEWNDSSTGTAIEGVKVAPWQGEPLPPLDLGEVMGNG